MGDGDWREKLAQKYHLDVPKEEEKKVDWGKRAEQFNKKRKPYPGARGNGATTNQDRGRKRSQTEPREMATAPYNFVSLPIHMMPAPLDDGFSWTDADEDTRREKYKAYILSKGKLDGFIELELETVTPCFIGGNGTEFFGPAGQPIIPGSTLRGMTKNIFKIITCGAMRRDEDITDRHLYSRGMAGGLGTFRDYYKNRMTETDGKGKQVSKANPGFLIRSHGEYFVCPADKEKAKIPKGEYQDQACIRWHVENSSADVITGRSPQQKYVYYTIQKPDWRQEKRIPVDKKVVEDYRLDKTRKGLDLFDKRQAKYLAEAAGFTHQKDVEFVVPCFYMEQGGKVQHFGHGRYYRIPYESTIGDHIPAEVREEKHLDFADAVFGRKEFWGSRVFFEDAELLEKAVFLQKNHSHPLMAPKPTSFQLYLHQNAWPPKHWDDKTQLRGYKMYWHQKTGERDWILDPAHDKKVKGTQDIHPLAKGCRFKGRIWFKHLSEIELGALCEVFSLETDKGKILYKIGQGKSIGMGSVSIKSQLYLDTGKKRYARLFDENGWQESIEAADAHGYVQDFHKYREKNMGEQKAEFEKSLVELGALMNWQNTQRPDWYKKTAMMKIGDKNDRRYKERAILMPTLKFLEGKLE